MLEKKYQKVFTQQKFNECQLAVEKNGSLIFTTKTFSSNLSLDSKLTQNPFNYTTYILKQKQLTTLPDFRIFDCQSKKVQFVNSNDEKKQSLVDIYTCGQLEVKNETLIKELKGYFGKSIVNLIDKNSHKSVSMNFKASVRINQDKNKLYFEDFEYNQNRFDVFNFLPKEKTNYRITKKRQTPILDLKQTSFQDLEIQNISFVNGQEVLLHLGISQQLGQKNIMLCKFNIINKTFQWKHKSGRFQIYLNRNIHINQNTFMNSVYNFDNYTPILQFFDYRMKGPALNLFTTSLPTFADFQQIERIDNEFKFMSMFASRGGAISQPFIFDIRVPDSFSIISLLKSQEKVQFPAKIIYQKPYLYAVQKQFQFYKFKKGKVSKYHFQY